MNFLQKRKDNGANKQRNNKNILIQIGINIRSDDSAQEGAERPKDDNSPGLIIHVDQGEIEDQPG
jgi:hypothetical protein